VFRDRMWPAALICSVIANVHRNPEDPDHPDPYSAAEFMPGARVQTQEDKLREFAERVLAGDTFEDEQPDEAELARFRKTMQSML